MRAFYIILTLSLCLLSCSVIEKRENCKCRLSIYIPESFCDKTSEKIYLRLENNNNVTEEDIAVHREQKIIHRSVNQGIIKIYSIKGLKLSEVVGDKILINKGEQADSIFTYSNTIVAKGEFAKDSLKLFKNFSTIEIQLIATEKKEISSIIIESNCAGISLSEQSPIAGKFIFSPKEIIPGILRCRVPRQGNSNLVIKVSYDKNRKKIIELDKILSSMGFNWQKPDLDDITLTLNVCTMKMGVNIKDWKEESADYKM